MVYHFAFKAPNSTFSPVSAFSTLELVLCGMKFDATPTVPVAGFQGSCMALGINAIEPVYSFDVVANIMPT